MPLLTARKEVPDKITTLSAPTSGATKSASRTPGAPDRGRGAKLDSMEMRTEMQTETQTAMPLQRFDGAALQSDQWNVDLEAGPGGEPRLLAAPRHGHSAAFGALLNRYQRRIFHLAQRLMRNHDDA